MSEQFRSFVLATVIALAFLLLLAEIESHELQQIETLQGNPK